MIFLRLIGCLMLASTSAYAEEGFLSPKMFAPANGFVGWDVPVARPYTMTGQGAGQQQMAQAPQQQAQRAAPPPPAAPAPQAAVPVAQPAAPGPTVAEMHQQWQLQCVGQPIQRCEVSQKVLNVQTKSIVVWFELARNKADGADMITLIVPLGVNVTTPVSLSVDGRYSSDFGLVTCLAVGCVAQFRMPEALLERMSQGQVLRAVIYNTAKQKTDLNLSLGGFTDAYIRMAALMRSK